ncbi:hypothetical protein F751_0278 [Auxenochlorella protothecoides]|uniref:Uncharacterized protein n=2 Tax=Auxenochlorella protothecoides TaxID=3075 RepID=A0A087SS33_AUXPR|nr:hypothetical protein F751_0278 [Auxenochlorella protothecoides]KFM28537.1 hypothetical protein F751_0278 [Auxenochlorella protothecoides]
MGAFGQAPDQQQGGFAFGAAQSAPAFGANPQPAFGFGAAQQQPAQPGMGGEAVPNAFGGGMPGAFSLGSNSQSESARRRVKVKRNVRRG